MYLRFTAQIRKKDFIRLFFSLTLRKPAIIISLILGFGLLGFIALDYLHFFKQGQVKNPLFMLFMGLSSILYLIFGIYRSAIKNFTSQERLNQELTYLITDDKITFIGQSFSNEFQWNSFYKIVGIGKDWIILYNSKTIANFLPLSGLEMHEAVQLKEFLSTNKAAWAVQKTK